MADLSTLQTVKQGTRQLLGHFNDKVAIASATVGRGDLHVRPSTNLDGFLHVV